MAPHDDDIPDITPDLSPRDDAAIRELLGSLGGAPGEAMPAAVQARLDAVIAEQAAQRTDSGTARNVRRLAVAWLGAAAAVFVMVAGIGVVVGQLGAGNDSADSQVSTATEADEGGASAEVSPSGEPDEMSDTKDQDPATDLALPVVRPDHLAEDARALQTAPPQAARVSPQARQGCVALRPSDPRRQVFAISYRGAPAVLIIEQGPPTVASVWSCDDELLQSVELPD